jgi:alkaline phosphatase
MASCKTVFNRIICIVLPLCLFGGFVSEQPSVFAAQPAAKPAARNMGEYWFYTPPTDRSPYPDVDEGKVKNVILMIGDGMGLAEVSTARIRAVGPGGRLHMDRMPVTGFATTYAANNLITDSAAGATALATGFKTKNGMVGLLPDERNVLSILEAVRDRKMATGLTVICIIPHATPAGFAAHIVSRNMYPQIYEQMLQNKVDVLFGSGNAGTATQPSGDATLAKKNGYHVISNRKELRSAKDTPVIGLFGIEGPSAESPRPMFAEMTAKAIELLNRDQDGFFLMVEGSDIDGGGHSKNTAFSIHATLVFDLAVKEALEFAQKDKHTLVVVTADHETGGMAITGGGLDGTDVSATWATNGHTGIPVPLYAFGPGARRFMGVHDNTEIPCIIAQLLGIKDFPKVFPKKQDTKK